VTGLVISLVLVLAFVVMTIVFAERNQRAKLQQDVLAIANELGGQISGQSVYATVDGVETVFRLAVRGSGKSAQRWTEVEVEVPAKYPLTLLVRRHEWRDGGKIERGEMVDVELGDRSFDDEFLVEAAPADVVKLLVDRKIRELMWSLENPELQTLRRDGKAVVQLAVRDWIRDRDHAARITRTLAVLGGSVRDAFATVEQATPLVREGAPFREILDDREIRRAAEARSKEVVHVEEVRAVRTHDERMVWAIGTVVFIVGSLLLLIALR
jgi:hypothetical protein